jgi:hypothetical protein
MYKNKHHTTDETCNQLSLKTMYFFQLVLLPLILSTTTVSILLSLAEVGGRKWQLLQQNIEVVGMLLHNDRAIV